MHLVFLYIKRNLETMLRNSNFEHAMMLVESWLSMHNLIQDNEISGQYC